jgi:UDP-N-acetylmuramate dehydrogenase
VVRQSADSHAAWIRLEGVTIQENVPLAPYTTLGVGGPARWFVRVTTESELGDAVQFARQRNLPLFVLGGGSNLLVSDSGFSGFVLQADIGGPAHNDLQGRSTTVNFSVPAGLEWDKFVEMTCRSRYTGIESLAGIPGLVGGTPVQNVGAYGQEVAQTITSVRVFNLQTLEIETLSAERCRFGYRSSIFNTTHRGRYVVTRVNFQFDLDAEPVLTYADLLKYFAGQPTPTPLQISDAVRTIRRSKGMLLVAGDPDSHSAGSFFKNPVVDEGAIARMAATLEIPRTEIPHWPAGEGSVKLPAAWLVERAGFHKGFHMGRAGISTKHTLALVNLGGATASEIVALRDAVIHKVEERFAIQLEQEPVMLGFTPKD